METQIRPVETRRDLQQFIRLPWRIYQDIPQWVPPLLSSEKEILSPKTGPFFQNGQAALFLAYRDQTPIGRISAHVNHQYERYRNSETGFFGFFECIDNADAARALLSAAETWLRNQGKTRMLGPMSFGLYDISGILIEGFEDPPVILTAYNPEYYGKLLEQAGLTKAIDWYAFLVHRNVVLHPALYRVRDRLLNQQDITFEILDMKRIDQAVDLIGEIFAQAWMENWEHVPFTDAELAHLLKELKPVVVPELTYLAFHQGQCIGFSLSIKDANPALKKANGRLFPCGLAKVLWHMRKVKRLRTIAMGVRKEYRHRGIDLVFYLNTVEQGRKLGFVDSECSIIVESNQPMIRALQDLDAKRYKTFRFFEKSIL
ncbi:N-acetyltransferase [candidate division KSB1 bacterium]|nr:N-acetyltransferase [candidate division KSB1 bacterium]